MNTKITKLDKINKFILMELPEFEYHDLNCYYTWMGDDGIMRTKVKSGARIKLEDAKANSEVVNSYQDHAPFPLIIDTTSVLSMSKDARDFLAIKNRETVINGMAIIRNSLIGNMVANFYIRLSKPTVPVKLFRNEEDAKMWCDGLKTGRHEG
ncbi:hypothetical protein K6119_12335 [Paracrocinitomix mangrovi]|uniref:DUF7793 family protein n=1 Tax=Paracrocinitomix mangrovi TaxID=2862509 RepID=UPI001EDABC87|nr:hypothetical protein [Paracrocinitomix mangrovi]UKN00520.1 hypothetical protein K6119_12335 [Paracrocinitomix mangrovi]